MIMTLLKAVAVMLYCAVVGYTLVPSSGSSSLWGSYLPGLHLGARAKADKSLILTIAWSNLKGSALRHDSTKEVRNNRWVAHDGR